jgi:hypothetical protein
VASNPDSATADCQIVASGRGKLPRAPPICGYALANCRNSRRVRGSKARPEAFSRSESLSISCSP